MGPGKGGPGWVLDTGAGVHICPDRQAFNSLRPSGGGAVVGVGSSSVLGVGEVQLAVPRREDGKLLCLLLPRVLWVPRASSAVISMSKLQPFRMWAEEGGSAIAVQLGSRGSVRARAMPGGVYALQGARSVPKAMVEQAQALCARLLQQPQQDHQQGQQVQSEDQQHLQQEKAAPAQPQQQGQEWQLGTSGWATPTTGICAAHRGQWSGCICRARGQQTATAVQRACKGS